MKVSLIPPKFSKLNQTRGIGVYAKNLQKNLPKDIQSHKNPDIIHFLNFDLFFLSLPLKKTAKWVVTIHDVIPLIFPEHFPPGIRGQLKFIWQKLNLSRVDAIITDSKNSQKDIIKYLDISPSKIHVIYLGVDKSFRPLNLPKKPYILYVGDKNYNKNVPALQEAFSQLNRPDLNLILAGKVWGHTIKNLPRLYNQAKIYIQPSLYEGFGLPVLEAMACGTPVVSSNTSSLPEVCGSAAIMVKPTPQDLAAGLRESLALSPKQRQSYIKAGLAQAAKFTWTKTAQATLEVYNKVLAGV